jgi:uncharacterized membrane protein
MRLLKLWDDLQESMWLRPALWSVGLSILALTLTTLDRSYFSVNATTLPWFLISQANGAATMLGPISGAMLT